MKQISFSLISTGNVGWFTFVLIILFSCNNNNQNDRWQEVLIDAGIKQNNIYQELDKQSEIFSAFEINDSLMKRTSDVAYITGGKINSSDSFYAKYNNCRAN